MLSLFVILAAASVVRGHSRHYYDDSSSSSSSHHPPSKGDHCSRKSGKCCVRPEKVQTIEKQEDGPLDPDATVINIDTNEDWYPVKKTFLRKCRNFTLPFAKDGEQLTIFNHHVGASYFWHPNPYGRPRIPGFDYAPGRASQFRWFAVNGLEQTVELTWIEHNHGWTITNQAEAQYAGVEILSIRPDAPDYFYMLSTAKLMYDDDDESPEPTRPAGVREGLVAVAMNPNIPSTYGTIKHKEYVGAAVGTAGEVHHGGILHYPHNLNIFAAPSLDFEEPFVALFDLSVPGFPREIETITRAQFDALGVSALHTSHLNPQSGKLLISYLYNTTAAADDYSSAGGLLEISSNFGAGGNEPTVSLFHKFADDDRQSGQAATLPGGYTLELPLFCNEDNAVFPDLTNCSAVEEDLGLPDGALPRTFATELTDGTAYDFTLLHCQSAVKEGAAGIENGMTIGATSWSRASVFNGGFGPFDPYGRHVRIYDGRRTTGKTADQLAQPEAELVYTVELGSVYGPDPQGVLPTGPGIIPLEMRPLHDPRAGVIHVGVTLPGAILTIFQDETTGAWDHEITVPPLDMMGHINDCESYNPVTESFSGCGLNKITNLVPGAPLNLPWLNATALGLVNAPVPLVTDITIAQDDKFLYAANWFAGCVLQYDIRDRTNVFLAGGICNLGGVTNVFAGTLGEWTYNPNSWTIADDWKGTGKPLKWAGAPQMLRLFKSGRKLFVSNSLFASWDEQYYPVSGAAASPDDGSFRNGGMAIVIDTGVAGGEVVAKMSVDTDFGVNGVLVHEEGRLHEAHGLETRR